MDRVAQNNGGAFAVRQSVFHEIVRGNDRLVGKRIVIWQFATRDLTTGDWKLLPMPTAAAAAAQNPETSVAVGESIVQGTVRTAAKVPRPGSVPYRDAVTGIHFVDVKTQSGPVVDGEIIVYSWGMRDNQLTKEAQYTSGQQVTLRLVPWESVKDRYGRLNRVELPTTRIFVLPIYRSTGARPMNSTEGDSLHQALCADRLKGRIVEQVVPLLARGFMHDREQRSAVTRSPTDHELHETFIGTVSLLFRLLFLLFAEARRLLPAHEAPYHDAAVFSGSRHEIAEHAGR